MDEVSIRDLRNHGGEVLERVAAGEQVTVTRAGKPVAVLTPVRRTPLSAEEIVEHARSLPPLDPQQLRDDIDAAALDSGL
jgi:prevent-host-death family protein